MKKSSVLLASCVLLSLGSCTRENASTYEANPTAETVEQATAPPQLSFTQFANELAPLDLPFTAVCSFPYVPSVLVDTATVGRFLAPLEVPYRKLEVNQNVTALLVLYPADETLPRLKTFNQNGDLLAQQDLKFLRCGEEPGLEHREQFTIQKDFNILHVDSTYHWKTDAAYNEVPNTRKLTVTKRSFKIQPTGQIVEVK